MRVNSARKIKSHEQQTSSTNYYQVQVIFYVIFWNSHNLNFTVLHLIQKQCGYMHTGHQKHMILQLQFQHSTEVMRQSNRNIYSKPICINSVPQNIYHPPKTRNWMHIGIYWTMHTICNSAITNGYTKGMISFILTKLLQNNMRI